MGGGGGNDLFHQKAKLSFFMIRRQNSKVAVRSYESVWSDRGSNGAVFFSFPLTVTSPPLVTNPSLALKFL